MDAKRRKYSNLSLRKGSRKTAATSPGSPRISFPATFTPRLRASFCGGGKSVLRTLIDQPLYNLERRVCADSLVEDRFLIFDVVRAWVNPARKERRTRHHNGDGTFTLPGRPQDSKDRMVRGPEFTFE